METSILRQKRIDSNTYSRQVIFIGILEGLGLLVLSYAELKFFLFFLIK